MARKPSGAGHVLHHDRRLTRDALANMPGDQPAVQVIAAAGVGGHDQSNGLAAVEVSDGLRPCGRGRDQQRGERQ